MSQQQFFGDGGSPSFSGIETVTGDTGGPVPGSGVPVNLNLIGDSAQGTQVNGTPGTSTQQVTNLDATAAASAGAAQKGAASFNSDDFSVVNGFVSLANSIVGTTTTVGAVLGTTITFPLGATPACYQFQVDTTGFEAGLPSGVTAQEIFGVYTDGATATLIDAVDFNTQVGPGLVPALFYSSVSGNNVVVQVVGSPTKTVNWLSKLTYIKVT